MKHLFLSSQVQFVTHSIANKLGDKVGLPAVFITTPINDKPHSNLAWHYANKSSMEKQGISFDEYDITGKTASQIESDLSKYQIMYIEGGNSYYLLQESQKSGFDKFVKQRVEEGMIYLGTSAGTVIAGPDIEPVRQDSRAILAKELRGTKGYGLVDFVVMPHWGSPERRELFNKYRLEHIYQEDYPYILINDNQYVEVVGDSFHIVTVS